MTTVENYWAKNFDEKSKNPVQEELLVFGYGCKLFRDDEKALYIDQGKHLIPWMNDGSLMIDRYDVRGYLHDLSLYEPKPVVPVSLTLEETRIEQTCEEERYLALHKDLTEEEMYHEEELKRLKAALASEGAYHEIAFTYEDENSQSSTSSEDAKADETDEQFTVPSGLVLPAGIQVPPTMKLHRIIEKTATFVAQHGGQMEIIIKMKQSSNPQFEFLSFDHVLNPYYKFLVSSIKSGKYVPLKTVVKSEDEDDDDADGHYLHPSLFAAKPDNTPMSLPNIQFRCDENDTYSLLVKNLNKLSAPRKAISHHRISHTAKSKTNTPQPTLEKKYPSLGMSCCDQPPPPGEGPALLLPSTLDSMTGSPGSSEKLTDILSQIIPPPPDIQPVIDKMATYVAKNGEDFETIVKSKGDKRFDFLLSWHEYYPYYLFKKKLYSEEKRQQLLQQEQQLQQQNQEQQKEQEQAAEAVVSEDQENSKDSQESETNKSSKNSKAPVSFSIKTKDTDTLQLEKKKTALLLDDDSGEDDVENQNSDMDAKAKLEHKEESVHIDSPSKPSDMNPAEAEDRPRKLTQEELEAKFAEERIKDKLVAAARERLAQQARDRQLQQERKRKAALFLNKLKNPDLSEECAQSNFDSITAENCDKQNKKSHPSALSSAKTSPLNSPEFQTSPFLSLPSSPIPLMKEENNDKAKGFSMTSFEDSVRLSRLLAESGSLTIQRLKSKSQKRTPSPSGRPHHRHRHRSPSHPISKPKKRSRSKDRTEHKKRSRSSSKSRIHKKHLKSPSEPPKLKDDRSKTPPAAYSLVRRSKTRSPSPSRRHRYVLPVKHKAPRK